MYFHKCTVCVGTTHGWSVLAKLIFASILCMSTRLIDLCLRAIMRAMWFCGGFHWIKVKGERAAPSEVPILTVAPHSSYFDAIPVTMTMCSIVAKLESRSVPVWGSELNGFPSGCTTHIFRERKKSNSTVKCHNNIQYIFHWMMNL